MEDEYVCPDVKKGELRGNCDGPVIANYSDPVEGTDIYAWIKDKMKQEIHHASAHEFDGPLWFGYDDEGNPLFEVVHGRAGWFVRRKKKEDTDGK